MFLNTTFAPCHLSFSISSIVLGLRLASSSGVESGQAPRLYTKGAKFERKAKCRIRTMRFQCY